MEAAVGRMFVLREARGTEGKDIHRRVRPVVGQITDDREARPAIRAVDERIAEPPIRRVLQLRQTVRTGGDIGGDERERPPGLLAGRDAKDPFAQRRDGRCGHALDLGERRQLRGKARHKGGGPGPRPLHLDRDAVGTVQHPPPEAQFRRQAMVRHSVGRSQNDADAKPYLLRRTSRSRETFQQFPFSRTQTQRFGSFPHSCHYSANSEYCNVIYETLH